MASDISASPPGQTCATNNHGHVLGWCCNAVTSLEHYFLLRESLCPRFWHRHCDLSRGSPKDPGGNAVPSNGDAHYADGRGSDRAIIAMLYWARSIIVPWRWRSFLAFVLALVVSRCSGGLGRGVASC
jgi:hypothetical protein